MRSIIIVLCALTLVNCSDSDKKGSGENVSTAMRGTFTVEAESKSLYYEANCPTGALGDMDPRLKAGMVFDSVRVEKEYDEASVQQTLEQLAIQTIDHDQNFFVAQHTLAGPVKGWYVGKTQFEFSPGMGGLKMEVIKVSPNFMPLWQKSKQQGDSDDDHEWTSCVMKTGTSTYEYKNEDGTFTFTNGTTVKAQKETRTEKGTLECIRMKHTDGQSKELSRTEVGAGSVTDISINTLEVPSPSSGCSGKINNIYRQQETILDTSKLLIFDSEELLKFN